MRYAAPLLVSLSLLLGAGAAAAAETFTVHLGPTPLNDATKPKIRGRATATATLTGAQLSVAGAFSGLSSPATTAELHAGGGVGVPGPAISPLTVTPAAQGELSGQVKLTASQVKALRQGRLYVQINSQSAPPPAGNLWGWVLSPTLVLPGTNAPAAR